LYLAIIPCHFRSLTFPFEHGPNSTANVSIWNPIKLAIVTDMASAGDLSRFLVDQQELQLLSGGPALRLHIMIGWTVSVESFMAVLPAVPLHPFLPSRIEILQTGMMKLPQTKSRCTKRN